MPPVKSSLPFLLDPIQAAPCAPAAPKHSEIGPKRSETEPAAPKPTPAGQPAPSRSGSEPTFSLLRLDIHSRFADEIALCQIQWGAYSDDEIIECFRAWLKANRPDPLRPPGRGRKPKDWRANLTRLAVMRLLRAFTTQQLLDFNTEHVPGLWRSVQFSGSSWLDEAKWHEARREARATFHQLFPFLPLTADPLSWPNSSPSP